MALYSQAILVVANHVNKKYKQESIDAICAKTYLTGGPLLHEGLSPRVLAYSRIPMFPKLIPLLDGLPMLAGSDLVDWFATLCKLSSTVLHFRMDFCSRSYGTDMHRFIRTCPAAISGSCGLGACSLSLLLNGAIDRCSSFFYGVRVLWLLLLDTVDH